MAAHKNSPARAMQAVPGPFFLSFLSNHFGPGFEVSYTCAALHLAQFAIDIDERNTLLTLFWMFSQVYNLIVLNSTGLEPLLEPVSVGCSGDIIPVWGRFGVFGVATCDQNPHHTDRHPLADIGRPQPTFGAFLHTLGFYFTTLKHPTLFSLVLLRDSSLVARP
jgi:hypothetical protein